MKILKLINNTLHLFVPLFFIFGISTSILGQCTGTDNNITICNKHDDIANRTFDLFNQLNGTPTLGGIWSTTDAANFFALNQATGIVDLWRITNFGVHQFTYTNDFCGESAIITINLGGYSGENNINGSANACSDDSSVNLHGFLGSEIDGKVQDFNGLWEEDPLTITNQLDGNIFNAQAAGPGIYSFTYTVEAVSSCPSITSTVILEIHPAANPGTASSLTFCTNDDFSNFTNFDLIGQLTGQDANGTWSENGTNQLSDLNDSVINIEELNNTFGYGTYSFTYTVYPTHPICLEQEVTVNINILPVLDGTMTAANYCFGTEYLVNLNYDDAILHNGSFLLEYQINGTPGVASAVMQNGIGSFIVDPSLVPANQMVTLEITGIDGVTPIRDLCPSIIVPSIAFLATSSKADVTDICVQTDATVTLTDILDANGNKANGNYILDYTLTDPNATDSNFNLTDVSFTNGNANFIMPASNFMDGGNYTVSITIANTFPLNCGLIDILTVTPTPDIIQLDLQVDNNCDATQIDVIIDAPILGDGTYTITYDVTELGSNAILTTNTINFTGGTANYQIDVDALPDGNYIASVRSIQNDTTPCRLLFEFEEAENFAKGGITEPPQADANQIFCISDYPTGPTLEDIMVTATGDILFYATATDTNILALTTPLVDGEDYFVTNTDSVNNCEGTDRIQIFIIFSDPIAPTTTEPNPAFCGENNPMLSNISVTVSTGNTVVWFDAPSNGNLLENNTSLVDGQSYYAATQETGQCISTDRLEIIPTVTTIAPTSLSATNLAVCGLDNPTIIELRLLENEITNTVFWYTSATEGVPLSDDVLLIRDTTYYAENFNPLSGCSSSVRIPVTIDLSNCDPEEYDFFIPDGFSPNSDGRNDTFYIPNIDTIFPDFTLEILNRYGATMFKGNKDNPVWDGRSGSSIAPNGVYFYIVNYNKNNSEPIQGRLYLNR